MTERSATYNDTCVKLSFHVPVPSVVLVYEYRHTEFSDVIQSYLAIITPAHFSAWMRGNLHQVFPNSPKGLYASIKIACKFPQRYDKAVRKVKLSVAW